MVDMGNLKNEYQKRLKDYAGATTQAEQLAALYALLQARQQMDEWQSAQNVMSLAASPQGYPLRSDVLGQGGSATIYNLPPTAANIDRVVGPSFNNMTQGGGRYLSPYEQYQIAKYGGIMDVGAQEHHPLTDMERMRQQPISQPEPDIPRTNWYSAGTNVGLPAYGAGPQESEGNRVWREMQARQRADDSSYPEFRQYINDQWPNIGRPLSNPQPLSANEIQGYGTYLPQQDQYSWGIQHKGGIQPFTDVTDYSKYYPQSYETTWGGY